MNNLIIFYYIYKFTYHYIMWHLRSRQGNYWWKSTFSVSDLFIRRWNLTPLPSKPWNFLTATRASFVRDLTSLRLAGSPRLPKRLTISRRLLENLVSVKHNISLHISECTPSDLFMLHSGTVFGSSKWLNNSFLASNDAPSLFYGLNVSDMYVYSLLFD